MKTIRIQNGLIKIDEFGNFETIEDIVKASQDLARNILTDYNQFFDTGSNINKTEIGSMISELAIERSISDAIYRLIAIQAIRSQDDRIIRVNQIKTAKIDNSTVVFYVEVLHESGKNASFSAKIDDFSKQDHLISE